MFFTNRGRRREVMFGLPRSRPLNKRQRADIWRYAANYNRRLKKPGQHGGPLTHATLRVLQALLDHVNWHTGHSYPSIDTLARTASCAPSTVQLAIAALERANIITWVNRIVFKKVRQTCKITGRIAWVKMPRRTSNFYIFKTLEPAAGQAGSCAAQQDLFAGPYDTERRSETQTSIFSLIGEPPKPVKPSVSVSRSSVLEAALAKLSESMRGRPATL